MTECEIALYAKVTVHSSGTTEEVGSTPTLATMRKTRVVEVQMECQHERQVFIRTAKKGNEVYCIPCNCKRKITHIGKMIDVD